jgi:hypothetical protein
VSEKRAERHARRARGQGHQVPHHRQQAREEDSGDRVAVDPLFGQQPLLLRHEQIPAVLEDQRAAEPRGHQYEIAAPAQDPNVRGHHAPEVEVPCRAQYAAGGITTSLGSGNTWTRSP